jgi:DNA polymerase-3 subunit delta'
MTPQWLRPEQLALADALVGRRLGHAPMLLGSPGVGKRALADWLAGRLLCLEPDDVDACGRCQACRLLDAGAHPDFFRLRRLEEKTEILVDQVREFIASLALTPSVSRARVGLISPADALNRNAANALLKTLEEPADNVWLVLVTDHEDRLPATVISRCQRRYIAVPDPASALDWLDERHGDRGPEACRTALALADGAPLLADRWLAGAGLEHGLSIRDGLAGVLRCRADEAELVAEWQDDPATTWAWLARFSQLWLRAVLSEPPEVLADVPVPPSTAASREALQLCWQRALEGARLCGRGIRHDWLLRAWLAEWRRMSRAESGTLPAQV